MAPGRGRMTDQYTTDFGRERVSPKEKTERVGAVFRSVSHRYDLMNDLMSFGLHRLMKRATVEMSAIQPGDAVLDLAGGTADLAALYAPLVGEHGSVIAMDINEAMLRRGRDRLLDRGIASAYCVQANAESLPLGDGTIDCLSIAFGLRNLTHKERALSEMHRVLKSGGRLLVLEFSTPRTRLHQSGFDMVTALWPTMGRLVTGDESAYRYLVDSIAMHPDQETLAMMLEDAGFARTRVFDMLGGIAALHLVIRP